MAVTLDYFFLGSEKNLSEWTNIDFSKGPAALNCESTYIPETSVSIYQKVHHI